MRVLIAYRLYLNNVAAMAAVPKAFATAADIRIRAMSFLNRRQNMQLMLTSFSGVLIPQVLPLFIILVVTLSCSLERIYARTEIHIMPTKPCGSVATSPGQRVRLAAGCVNAE
jgi:hypothetical protein